MRVYNVLIHDDTMSGASSVFTRPDFNDKLGSVDRLAFLFITDQANATGSITAQLQHSPDGLNWKDKGDAATVTITLNSVVTTAVFDDGTVPSFAFVRMKMSLNETAQVHVRIWATGRDDS